MKACLVILLSLFSFIPGFGQQENYKDVPGLLLQLSAAKTDAARIMLKCRLGEAFRSNKLDTSFLLVTEASSINIIPQDIGRVILNLISNAFYAVDEKKKRTANGYEPTVSVSTKKMIGKAEIKVADNGNGVPQMVLDKIFQPVFTTKPTGHGTGLGLSLSYDIVKHIMEN